MQENLAKLLEIVKKSEGAIGIGYLSNSNEWWIHMAWGKEAEDSPMYAAVVDVVGNSPEDVFQKAVNQLERH